MSPPRILLAEDDPEMRAWVRLVLGSLPAQVVEASDGVELLDLIAGDEAFDLVITDVRMPAPSGLQVVSMARTAGSTAPFLVITAFPGHGLRDALERNGAVLLAKPFDAGELRDAVSELLSMAKAGGSSLQPVRPDDARTS